jgi:hypothetical protein
MAQICTKAISSKRKISKIFKTLLDILNLIIPKVIIQEIYYYTLSKIKLEYHGNRKINKKKYVFVGNINNDLYFYNSAGKLQKYNIDSRITENINLNLFNEIRSMFHIHNIIRCNDNIYVISYNYSILICIYDINYNYKSNLDFYAGIGKQIAIHNDIIYCYYYCGFYKSENRLKIHDLQKDKTIDDYSLIFPNDKNDILKLEIKKKILYMLYKENIIVHNLETKVNHNISLKKSYIRFIFNNYLISYHQNYINVHSLKNYKQIKKIKNFKKLHKTRNSIIFILKKYIYIYAAGKLYCYKIYLD